MGRRILASLLAMALIFVLPVFSYADRGDIILKDSGSPEVSMMAMRSIAANEGISLAAAEGNSGQYGYNIEPYSVEPVISFIDYSTRYQVNFVFYSLPAGSYSFDALFNSTPISCFAYSGGTFGTSSISGNRAFVNFSLDAPANVTCAVTFSADGSLSDLSYLDYSFDSLIPVEGISSGYTYSSGIINKSTRSIFDTITADFGNQPSGKYLINIYHWGDSYDVTYQISDSTESYYLPCSTSGSVTTLVYNHPGGSFTLKGSFTASNDETSVVDGTIYGGGQGSYAYIGGDITANGSLSWVFNITDIVAIPYEQASDSNFGLFAPIIGYFNDHFSSMKSWIATQIDKIAGDDQTKATVDNAASELEQEVQDLNTLSSDLTTQAGNLEQQFSTDFAIPSEISGFSGSVQSIYSFLFSSLGVFSIFIWLPIVLAVIKKLLRL